MILFEVERVVVTWEGRYEDGAMGGAEQPWIARFYAPTPKNLQDNPHPVSRIELWLSD